MSDAVVWEALAVGACRRCGRLWKCVKGQYSQLVEQERERVGMCLVIQRCPICRYAEAVTRRREYAEWDEAGRPL